ncbi:TBC1 domain family member 10A isoform X2 [Rissa tridactyla]|uniref:TBC1 domain family member 10A isoform X2 n=1 Tax=Rissa tridactyla TaxID=75485 RepID=UPI0023BACB3B|nr:TBC1 domain family member 10A isoform X2 [Rissa tridactyla]
MGEQEGWPGGQRALPCVPSAAYGRGGMGGSHPHPALAPVFAFPAPSRILLSSRAGLVWSCLEATKPWPGSWQPSAAPSCWRSSAWHVKSNVGEQGIRLRCQKGIPPSLRGRAWQYLSGSKVKLEQNIGKFDELDLLPGDPKWLDVIERDLHRQFPFHEMFVSRGGHGQQDLFRVLKAYTLYRPEEGYCQAQAPIAAVLLMHMPAEQAFWCLVQICEKYLPGYYSEKLEAIQLDGQILFSLLHKVSPVAYKHLSKQKIDPILYMTEWFMCAFSRTLPWSSVLRVWDMFFCEGVKIIFRVGLVLLKHTLGSSDKLKSCQGQYETMERLRALSPKIMQETFLVQEVIELPVTERQIEREHLIQLKKWRETHGELQCKSPPRLHGAKAISEAEPPTRKALEPVPSIIVPPGPAPVPKARKSKEKSREKGPASPANGPGAEGNGAPGSARELLHPQVSPHHQSKESLSSRESEDTYL